MSLYCSGSQFGLHSRTMQGYFKETLKPSISIWFNWFGTQTGPWQFLEAPRWFLMRWKGMREENRGARVWQRRAKFYFAGWEFLLANSKSVRTDRILFYAGHFSVTHFLLFAALSDPTFIVNFDILLTKKILHNFHFFKYCIKILLILISNFCGTPTNILPEVNIAKVRAILASP